MRPSGNSMSPRIRSGDVVTIVPVDPDRVQVGDVVLARVRGRYYLHLVAAIDHRTRKVQIANNHGHVNGWTTKNKIFGYVPDV